MPNHSAMKYLNHLLLLVLLAWLLPACASTPSSQPQAPAAPQQLVVGVAANARPLIYKEGGELKGLEIDLAQAFARHLNMEPQFVELDWLALIPALEQGKIDIIMSGMSITRLRSVRIDFSNPYTRSGQMMLVRLADGQRYPRGYYDLKWRQAITVATVKGTTGEGFARRHLKRAMVRSYGQGELAVAALLAREVDVFISDAPMVAVYAAQHEGQLQPVYSLLTEEYLAWGIGKHNPTLQKLANGFLAQMEEDGRLQQLLGRWLPFYK